MARSRIIKPGLAENEVLAELGPAAQLLFAMLPCHADREGRLEDRPKRLKAKIFPYYAADVDSLLSQLAECSERFISRYEIDGKRYIQITNFESHQSPHHKEADSIIQPCPKHESSMSQACFNHDNLGSPKESNKNKEEVTSNKKEKEDDFEIWWAAWPKKTAKGQARKAYVSAIGRLAKSSILNPTVFILDMTVLFSQSDKAKGGFCPNPATWLNSECYDDDPVIWKQVSSNGTTQRKYIPI